VMERAIITAMRMHGHYKVQILLIGLTIRAII